MKAQTAAEAIAGMVFAIGVCSLVLAWGSFCITLGAVLVLRIAGVL